jgi:hypothetical protein
MKTPLGYGLKSKIMKIMIYNFPFRANWKLQFLTAIVASLVLALLLFTFMNMNAAYLNKQKQEKMLKDSVTKKIEESACCLQLEQSKIVTNTKDGDTQIANLMSSIKATQPDLLTNLKVISFKRSENKSALLIEMMADYGKTKRWLSDAIIGISDFQLESFVWKTDKQNKSVTDQTTLTVALSSNEKQ